MIAKIIKVTDDLLDDADTKLIKSSSYNLPLFDCNLDYAYEKEISEWVLQLWSIQSKHIRYPSWKDTVNEDELKKINAWWDYCVTNNKDVVEFEL